MELRLQGDARAVSVTTRNEQDAQRYARKLLHRMSESLAFAFLCEAAAEAREQGNSLPAHTAWRFYEEIESPVIGSESDAARKGVLEVLVEGTPQATEK